MDQGDGVGVRRTLETWASVAPLACAVHCLLTPVLVVLAPWMAVDAVWEAWMLAGTLGLGGLASWTGIRVHGQYRVLAPVLFGSGLWAAALAGWFAPIPEPAVAVVGAGAMAAGTYWSGRLRSAVLADACGCIACEEGSNGREQAA